MPKPRNSKLESPTARLRLPIGGEPHWITLGPGLALGYRRNEGAGTWTVRVIAPQGRWMKRIGLADDFVAAAPPAVLTFWQAQEEARRFAAQQPGAPVDESRPVTVSEALERYEQDLRSRQASIYNATWPRRLLSPALLAKPVQLLMASELKRWRDGLVDGIRQASTINRMIKGLKAALTIAAKHDRRIANLAEVRHGLEPLPNAAGGGARNVILEDHEVRALIAAAWSIEPALGLLVETLAVTGARPSQALRLTVADLMANMQRPRLMMPRSGKGGGRNRVERRTQHVPMPITPGLARKLQAAAAGRPKRAQLLVRANGEPWATKDAIIRRFRSVVAAAGLDSSVTAYALRHSAICRALMENVPIRIVAATCDTSVQMIEANYSRHIAAHSDELSRRGLLQDEAPADNVVPIAKR